MADVYSLVCWGGRTGKTVSLSATTDVVTLSSHGLPNGKKLWPSGTLPAELSPLVPVYARSTASNTFTLHTTPEGAIANTGQIFFTGSATYAAMVLKSDLVASPATALAAYGLSDLDRWGTDPLTRRIYDSWITWTAGRASASTFDVEYCEIGEAFTDYITTIMNGVPAAVTVVATKINGIRSAGFHGGVVGAGYVAFGTVSNAVVTQTHQCVIDGVCVTTNANVALMWMTGSGAEIKNCIIYGPTGSVTGIGLSVSSVTISKITNNLIIGFAVGIRLYTATYYTIIAHNLIAKCTNAWSYQTGNATNAAGGYFNNICVMNGTNWLATQPTSINIGSGNAGEAGNAPWKTGSNPTYTVSSADFVNLGTSTPASTDDYRPSSASAVQVETASDYYDRRPFDIADAVRPSYKGGAAAYYDIGPYEFDQGYGPWPASHVLTLDNVVVGSRVFVRDQGGTVTHYDQIAATSTVVITATVYGDSRDQWRIKVRKASGSPTYIPYETLMTATPGSSSIYVSQIPDE